MKVVRDVLLVAVAALIAIASLTFPYAYFGLSAVGSEVTARGEATAQQCRFSGPLTEPTYPEDKHQAGWWWVCEAEVRFDDGRTQQVETQYSQLTDADVGRPVRVVERLEAASKAQYRSVIYRADFEPRPVLGGASMLGMMLLALLVGLVPMHRLVRMARGKPADPDD